MRTSKLLVFSFSIIFACDFYDRLQYIDGMPKVAAATYIFSVLRYACLGLLALLFFKKAGAIKREMPRAAYYLFILWWIWCALSVVRGVVSARDYWDWKFLVLDNTLRLSVHLAIIGGIYLAGFRELFLVIVGRLFIPTFLLLYLSSGKFDYFYSYMVMPVTLFLLAVPFVKNRYKLIILLVSICSLIFALDFRANAMRISFGLALLLVYYLRKAIPRALLKWGVVVAMISPIVILYLGVSGQFNPFSEISKVSATKKYADGVEENLTADTRTFLYSETLHTLVKRDSLVAGEGAAGSYDSDFAFEYLIDSRRFATEVGFLNVILHAGIIGVVLYFLIIFFAAYYGVWKSNNWFSRMLGLAIAFRWPMFFIEDPTAFNLSMFFFWISIGLLFSKSMRGMSDESVCRLLSPKVWRVN